MNKMLLRFGDSDPGMVPTARQPSGGREIHPAAVATAILRHKGVLVISVLVALTLGILHVLTTPSLYLASSEVMIGDEIPGVGDGLNNRGGFAQNDVMLESAQRVLKSQKLALAVVEELDLHERASFMSPEQSAASQAVRFLRNPMAGLFPGGTTEENGVSPEVRDTQLRMSAADTLSADVEVRRHGRSSVFSISYSSTDPETAAAVVNAYGRAIVSDQMIGNVEASARVLDWLQDRLFVIQENATTAALEAEEFRAINGLLAISGEPITIQTISQLNSDLAAASVQLARTRALNSVYGELRELDAVQFVQAGGPGARISDDEFSAGQQRLLSLLRRAEQVERQYGPDHVEVVQLHDLIEMEGISLKREMRTMHETSLNAARALEAEVEMLRDSIAEAAEENLQMATARVELRGLERQAEIFEALNETYLLRLKDLEQTQTFPVTNVRVLSVADVPAAPFAPRKSVIMGLMLVLGAVTGSGVALFRERSNKFIRTKEELRDATGQPFLGHLPMMTQSEMEGPHAMMHDSRRPKLMADKRETFKYRFTSVTLPRSHFTETLRNIRVAYDASADGVPGYVLGVVSVRPGEGKSTVASNLAALVASGGRSVLLVDADLRTSGLSVRLRKSMGVGLREVLMGRAAWKGAIRQEATTGLHFLPSTFPQDDPVAGDMAGSSEFRELIREASKAYSLTILDLSPLGPVSDARALLPTLNGLIMVVEWNKMTRELMHEVLMRDPMLYEKILGVVYNKTNMDEVKEYDSSYPTEQYGYGHTEQKI